LFATSNQRLDDKCIVTGKHLIIKIRRSTKNSLGNITVLVCPYKLSGISKYNITNYMVGESKLSVIRHDKKYQQFQAAVQIYND